MDCTEIFHFTNQNARWFGNLRCQNWFSIWFSEVNINLLNKNFLGLVQSLFPIGNSATNSYLARKGIFNFCGMMGNKHIGSPSPDVLKVGTNRVDLLQVDLTSSLQAKRAFEAAKRRSCARSSSRAILNRTKDFYESLPIGPSSLHFKSVAKGSYKPALDTLYLQIILTKKVRRRQRGWALDSQSGGHEFPQSCACSSDQEVDSGGDFSLLPFCTKAFTYSIYHSHGNKCTSGLSTALLQGFTITPLNSSKIILARWLVYLYLAALYRIFSPQRKSAIVRALRKASKQSLTSSNTGYALSMAGYYLFRRTTSSLVSRKDVPKILIVITDGRWVSYTVVTFCISLFNNQNCIYMHAHLFAAFARLRWLAFTSKSTYIYSSIQNWLEEPKISWKESNVWDMCKWRIFAFTASA